MAGAVEHSAGLCDKYNGIERYECWTTCRYVRCVLPTGGRSLWKTVMAGSKFRTSYVFGLKCTTLPEYRKVRPAPLTVRNALDCSSIPPHEWTVPARNSKGYGNLEYSRACGKGSSATWSPFGRGIKEVFASWTGNAETIMVWLRHLRQVNPSGRSLGKVSHHLEHWAWPLVGLQPSQTVILH